MFQNDASARCLYAPGALSQFGPIVATSSLFLAYSGPTSGLFRGYFWPSPDLLLAYSGPTSGLFRTYFWPIPGLFVEASGPWPSQWAV
jgi:hypothetical protein